MNSTLHNESGALGTLTHLKEHLQGQVIALGIGNRLRSDDGFGSLLAERLGNRLKFPVYDVGESPENYLEKVIREKPDTLVIIDAADFGGRPGELAILEEPRFQAGNAFSTHNSSVSLLVNYLKVRLKVEIIILMVQPKSVAFSDTLSAEVHQALLDLENWFLSTQQKKESL